MTPAVKYCGTFSDYSGYGQANRTFITALFIAGVEVVSELVVQVQERGRFGWSGELCSALQNNPAKYKIKIIHLTPDCYPRYMEKGKYHIGHLFWETDHLPKEWVDPCNKMQEIWTASENQAQMIRNSGVTVPVYCFPQPIDTLASRSGKAPYIIEGFSGFVFYSIFQWIERKNPKALLTNFWKAFSGREDVALLLKTYRVNYSETEFARIENDIRVWKAEMGLNHYPRVFLVSKLMDTSEMFRLHASGHCYVSTSRGEGWGIPAVESMLMGNPVISLDHTGFADYVGEGQFFPCRGESTKVKQVRWIPWYTPDQNWIDISDEDLVKQMLNVYNNRKQAKEVGLEGEKFVRQNFNYWTVGKAMRNRLEQIEKELGKN